MPGSWIRMRVLEEKDGPMLLHGLQEPHGSATLLPHAEGRRPNRAYWRSASRVSRPLEVQRVVRAPSASSRESRRCFDLVSQRRHHFVQLIDQGLTPAINISLPQCSYQASMVPQLICGTRVEARPKCLAELAVV